MDLTKIDLNHLVVFDALMRHGSVTTAGRELGLSQPATSYALDKMRQALGDPLFVRIGTRMQPTPRSQAMAGAVRDVLERIRTDVLSHAGFDPAQASREFRIAMSDVGESYFVPRLIRALHEHGPRLKLRVVETTPELLVRQLAEGELDLALGQLPDLHVADLYQQALFTSSFVCIARPGNPYIKGKLTMKQFLDAEHVDVSTPSRTQEAILRAMAERKMQRKVPLHVARFLTLLEIVPQTDLLALVPQDTGESLRQAGRVEVHALPFKSPTFRLRQHWHKRYNDDAANRWLRDLVRRLFASKD